MCQSWPAISRRAEMGLRFILTFILALTFLVHIPSPLHAQPTPHLDPGIGFYSGSFDPPTTAHLKIIREIASSGITKLVIFVNQSGVKDFKASSAERIAMLRAALTNLDAQVEFVTVPQVSKNLTLENLTKNEPVVYQFIGDDSFEKLPSETLGNTKRRWMVMPRTGLNEEAKDLLEKLGAEIFPISLPEGSSSTKLRADLARGNYDSPLLDPNVKKFIQDKNLYQTLSPEVNKIRKEIFEQSFDNFLEHTKKVVPDLDLSNITKPPFEPMQSQEAWGEKYINWVISQKKLSVEEEIKFRGYMQQPSFGNDQMNPDCKTEFAAILNAIQLSH